MVAGQIMAVIGSLAAIRIMTELLAPGAYGELALGMTAATLIHQTVLGPLGNGAARFYAPAVEKGELGTFLLSVGRMALAAAAVAVIVAVLALPGFVVLAKAAWIPITIAALLFALLSGCTSILSGVFNAARRRPLAAASQGLEPWARFLIASGLIALLGATSAAAMAGYAVAAALLLGAQLIVLRGSLQESVFDSDRAARWRERIWDYSRPFASWGAFYWAQSASDRWALNFFTTTQEVGLYAVLFQLGCYPMSTATGMVMQFLAPIFYQRAGDASDRERNAGVTRLSWQLTGVNLGVTGAAFLLAFVFHRQIFGIIAGREYTSVSSLLPWVLLGGGIFSAGEIIALNLMSRMKTHTMTAAKIVTALAGVLLNFAGAYAYGIRGIVFAGVAFSILYFAWMVALLSGGKDCSG